MVFKENYSRFDVLCQIVQINGSQAMRTIPHNAEYIYVGYLADSACMVLPETCEEGGTVLFWFKMPGCVGREWVLSSKAESAAPGFSMECTNQRIKYAQLAVKIQLISSSTSMDPKYLTEQEQIHIHFI